MFLRFTRSQPNMEAEWLEYMGMSGRSLDSTAMTPVISSDDEAGNDDPWLPTTLNSYESVDRMAEHGNLSSDAHMSSGVDEHDIHAFGRVQPQLPDPSTPVGPGYCCRTNMNRDQWTPSELSLLSPFMPGRRLSIPTGPDITMQKANKKCCSTTSDEPFSTASSVTLQGDNMSQLQSDEEDDDDYDDTNDRHQTLCEQEQELIDDFSKLGETLSQLEIFVDAFYLGGYDAARLPTLIHNICCKITELQDSVSPLDIRLCAMNKEAADLGVTVETVNGNAKNLKAEIEDMDLSTLLIDLEPYRIFYSRSDAM